MAAHDSDLTLKVYLWLFGVILVILFFSLHIRSCERLSVPENFDQIAQNTPVLEFGSEHPHPKLKF